jgi:MoaA/NifB/PqqE/SkfB family radical SAM enzyme
MNGPLRLANDALNRIERRSGRVRLMSAPVEVTIEPTNECNSRCLMCLPYRRDAALPRPESGYMTLETLQRVGPVLRRARRVLLGGFGEPLMHPRYLELLGEVKVRVPYVYFFTNGTLIDRETAEGLVRSGVDRIALSMGGATEETVRHVRGVSFAAVAAGLGELAAAKSRLNSITPLLEFNVVQMRSVVPEMKALVDLAGEHGVEEIDTPQMWVESAAAAPESVIGDPASLAALEEAVRYAEERGIRMRLSNNPPLAGECRGPWSSMFVGYDGTIFSCASERFRMGNAGDDLLRIWRRGTFAELRARLVSDPLAVCSGCPVLDVASYTNPAVHGREVSEELSAANGSPVAQVRRVLDEG